MTARFRVLPGADRDLDDHAEYLGRAAGMAVVRRFYDAANATFEAIARTPGIGEPHISPNPKLRDLRVRRVEGFRSHLIFYQPDAGGTIQIVRVLHGARNVDRILADEGGDPRTGEPST